METEKHCLRVVVKVGTSTLTHDTGRLNLHNMELLARTLSDLEGMGHEVILVSSGAIAVGTAKMGLKARPTELRMKQAAAAVGQCMMMHLYDKMFGEYNRVVAQILLTAEEVDQPDRFRNFHNTMVRLLELHALPIINENDTVSVEQIRFGDNDTLAALVSCLVQADMCVIFSDIEGLYTANPTIDPTATLIPLVERITPELMASAGGVTSKVGSGGMITKIRAARVLMLAGIPMVICHGRRQGSLIQLAHGESVGTYFVARNKAHDISPRKLWIALGDTAKGVLVVDDGAKRALIDTGSSLLSVGITSVEGSFFRGDIVDIKDQEGHLFARGRVNAPSSEVSLARGRSQKEIRGNELLVNLGDKPAVHRDELVVFE